MTKRNRPKPAAPQGESDPRLAGRRRDRFLFRVPPEHALQLATDPCRFPEFNPFVQVPAPCGRVERLGNVYHQLFGFGPLRLSTRWETTSVEPPNLADRPPPAPPWTTLELGQLPLLGTWRSTTRYDSASAGTLVTHDLEYQLPAGAPGRIIDALVMRPLLGVGFAFLGRRLRRWVEAEWAGRDTPPGS